MKIVILFAVFFVCRIFQNIFTKRTSGLVNGRTQLLTYTSYQYLLCMLLSLPAFLSAKAAFPTTPALIWAVIGGIAMFSSSMCCLMALKSGAPIVPIFFGAITVMNLFEAIKNVGNVGCVDFLFIV